MSKEIWFRYDLNDIVLEEQDNITHSHFDKDIHILTQIGHAYYALEKKYDDVSINFSRHPRDVFLHSKNKESLENAFRDFITIAGTPSYTFTPNKRIIKKVLKEFGLKTKSKLSDLFIVYTVVPDKT
ncbi:MAG: hypothetical protein KKF46_05415 [Nanoarchaeota archaeon]|nr:hypothetical protein [Nanoarchaeota archaeon]MBU1321771.1 hypothetical protein [Nanoarchaeota archaeon]MBU1598470.1 hypothetical protein [Nanoarchaeota archaeon]MBU2442306.1 hypothetical protein [Nanoarchaeota archaeon]